MAKTPNTTPPADDADDSNSGDNIGRTQPIRRGRAAATTGGAAGSRANATGANSGDAQDSADAAAAANTPTTDEAANAAHDVQPTEQIATDPAPVSAFATAGGRASGLDEDVATKDSVFRRHPVATGVTAGVLAVILVSGLTAWGVGAAVTASLTSATAPTAPPSTAAPVTGGGGGLNAAGRVAFRATIQSIDASTWTIMTKKGDAVTITIDAATQFGTKAMAETASSFAVGDSVVIVATKSGDTATATRVVDASALGGRFGKGLGGAAGTGAGTSSGTGTGTGAATTPMAPMTPTPAPSSTTTT